MKAFLITNSSKGDSLNLARVCKQSVLDTGTNLEVHQFDAIEPPRLYEHIIDIFGEHVSWTWPKQDADNGLDLKTGLYKRAYQAFDQNRVIACALSHYKLWKKCADINETIVILEHDALFTKEFNPEKYLTDPSWGAIGLNNPRGNTRKGRLFYDMVSQKEGVQVVPTIDTPDEPPLPMGLAGNSAYMIRPFFAKKLLAGVKEYGMWPNDAIMCKQLFPELRVVYPFYTETQKNVSSTTK